MYGIGFQLLYLGLYQLNYLKMHFSYTVYNDVQNLKIFSFYSLLFLLKVFITRFWCHQK